MGKRKSRGKADQAGAKQYGGKGNAPTRRRSKNSKPENPFDLLNALPQTQAAREFVAHLRRKTEAGPDHNPFEPLDPMLKRQVSREMMADLRRLGGTDPENLDVQQTFATVIRNVRLALLLAQPETVSLLGSDAVELLRTRSCREAVILLDLVREDLSGRGLDLDLFMRSLAELGHTPGRMQIQTEVLRALQLLETLALVKPSRPVKGISIHAASLIWCSADEKEAQQMRDKWFKKRAYREWREQHTIGCAEGYERRRLHRPMELLALLERIAKGALPMDRDQLVDEFRAAVEDAAPGSK